ncbi:MAG: hypothetical protein GY795_34635 [Desulfobacterales bacterium]|nr:hypothetical protein [Desulfobacterales bacterium]
MGLKYKFKKAEEIIQRSDTEELKTLIGICKEIQTAEDELITGAEEVLSQCKNNCMGLCCRNICIDDIVTLLDFVYILAVDDSMKDRIPEYLKNETMFTSDCVFLENGKGPCIFSSNSRPEKCIITFCGDEMSIKQEIRLLVSKFNKLSRFVMLRKPRALLRSLFLK